MSKEMLVGADPEIIVVDRQGNPSHMIGLIGGTKEAPLPVKNGALQEDNVLFEYNIDPAASADEFVKNIQSVMNKAAEVADKHGRQLTQLASISFTEQQLAQLPPEAYVFGCEPDNDAVTGLINPAPSADDPGLRSAGGHIHLGHERVAKDEFSRRDAIVLMDYMHGLWSVTRDEDTRRRELYGKASAYRPKSYGVEYRTLSNFWIFNESDIRQAYEFTKKVVERLDAIEEFLAMADVMEVRNAINNSDKFFADRTLNMLAQGGLV